MHENLLAKEVVDSAFQIHNRLGPGLLESAYEVVLLHELRKKGLSAQSQYPVPLKWDGIQLDVGYRADLMIEEKLIVELKSTEQILAVHKKQLLTYLRIADCRLGLLVNFGEALIKDGISRVVNRLVEE